MDPNQAWAEHFGFSEAQLADLKKKAGEEDLLAWCLLNGKISESEFLQWATHHFELPSIRPDFFSLPPDTEFWKEVRDRYTWNAQLIPLHQWQNVILIGCLNPIASLELSQPYRYVLASAAQLKMYWASLQEIGSSEPTVTRVPSFATAPSPLEPLPLPPPIEEDAHSAPLDETKEAVLHALPDLGDMKIDFGGLKFDSSPSNVDSETAVNESPEPLAPMASDGQDGTLIAASDIDLSGLSFDSLAMPNSESTSISPSPPPIEAKTRVDAIPMPPPIEAKTRVDAIPMPPPIEAKTRVDAIPMPPPIEAKTRVDAIPMPPPIEAKTRIDAIPMPPPTEPREETRAAASTPPSLNDFDIPSAFENMESTEPEPPTQPRVEANQSSTKVAEERRLSQVLKQVLSSSSDDTDESLQQTRTIDIADAINRGKKEPAASQGPKDFMACKTYEHIAQLAISRIQQNFPLAMVLVFQNGQLRPWQWAGEWRRVSAAKPMAIDLATPGVFRIVFTTCLPYHGHVRPSSANDAFFAEWSGSSTPRHITITPVLINGQIAGMLFAGTNGNIDLRASLRTMEELTAEVAAAFSRLRTQKAA